jgi:PKD repeat protein
LWAVRAVAADWHVATNGSDAADGTSWATAKATIQAAVDVAAAGDVVWVTNGVYQTGGRAASGSTLTNRVCVDKAVAVLSVNGPGFTLLMGNPTNGNLAVRGVYLAGGATLAGFTVAQGATRTNGNEVLDRSGGGIFCASTAATVSNGVVTGNTASFYAGGVHGGTLFQCTLEENEAVEEGGGTWNADAYNCLYRGNEAGYGGGTVYGTLRNCTLADNTARYGGGGAVAASGVNCILYYNTAPEGANDFWNELRHCCVTPLADGAGNFADEPGLLTLANPRLRPGSACIDAGTNEAWMADAADWAGGARLDGGPVDVGACEFHEGAQTGEMAVAIAAAWTNVATGFAVPFTATVQGDALGFEWNWGDGGTAANEETAAHAFATAGVYDVVLTASNWAGTVAATATVSALENPVYYVSPGGGHAAPFTNWAGAATDIQSAVDVAAAGGLVRVSNGVYAAGGVAGYPEGSRLTNRVAIHRPMTVQSENGPASTAIMGAFDPATNGPASVRGVYLAEGATLAGFTVTNGTARAAGTPSGEVDGGGIWCAGPLAMVSNCAVGGNRVKANGGGVLGGRLWNCAVAGNVASNGGGTYGSDLTDCAVERNRVSYNGGGAHGGYLVGCVVTGNYANGAGGGVWQGACSNSVLANNEAQSHGAGAFRSTLEDCLVTGNITTYGSGGGLGGGSANRCQFVGNQARYGGGASTGALFHCVVSNNAAMQGGGAYLSRLTNCTVAANTAGWGGGLYVCTADVCRIEGNVAEEYGGGTFAGRSRDCEIRENRSNEDGGGAYQGWLERCDVRGNQANEQGGGGIYLTFCNCAVVGNAAGTGGGGYQVSFTNCTVVGNTAHEAGGAYVSRVVNTVLYFNEALKDPNYLGGTFIASCTTPDAGAGNLDADPRLASFDHVRLLPDSPCIQAGSNAPGMEATTDLAGRARIVDGVVDIGACEFDAGALTGALAVAIATPWTQIGVGFAAPFEAQLDGDVLGLVWNWGDGQETANAGQAAHAYAAPGVYDVVLRASNLTATAAATVTVEVAEMTLHVSPAGAHVPPFATWANAATTIQAAVDAAVPGAWVRVTNGVYDAGAASNYPAGAAVWTRVAIHRPMRVESVNGSGATVIQGAWHPGTTNGSGAVRCAYVTNGATLAGFTLTGGATGTNGVQLVASVGGGAWCAGTGAVLSNCVVAGNVSYYHGGGVYGGTCIDSTIASNRTWFHGGGAMRSHLERCLVEGNRSQNGGGMYEGEARTSILRRNEVTGHGGGAYYGTLTSCALVRNRAGMGGGSAYATLYNCTVAGSEGGGGTVEGTVLNGIVWHNTAGNADNVSGGTISNVCTFPMPVGIEGIEQDPRLASLEEPRLMAGSPCIDAGVHQSWMGGAEDLGGGARIQNGQVDVGAYETPVAFTGALTAACSADRDTVAAGFPVQFVADVRGPALGFAWTWGDGSGTNDQVIVRHAYAAPGTYSVVLTASNLTGSAGATVAVEVVEQPIHYVSPSGGHVAPYGTWANAATSIQAAVEAATVTGALVLVTNGTYETGSVTNYGGMGARVAIHKPIEVRSVNGPGATTIRGQGALRAVYLAEFAKLSGFTVRDGSTLAQMDGGGIQCAGAEAVVSNCVVTGCFAGYDGGGIAGGTVYNSLLAGNQAGVNGGGACAAKLVDCTIRSNYAGYGGGTGGGQLTRCEITCNRALNYGGGAWGGTIENSVLRDNAGGGSGGGVFRGTLRNSLVCSNWSGAAGGGAYQGSLYNCTVVGNGTFEEGGGTVESLLYNCIVYYNRARAASNYARGTIMYTCSAPRPAGEGNLSEPPGIQCFANARLLPGSPCIDAGTAGPWTVDTVDLAGRARTAGAAPDLGAYEYHAGVQTNALAARPWARWTTVAAGHPVPFRADFDGDATGFGWTWGDGTAGATNDPAPVHAFATAGTYNVVLWATNAAHAVAGTATVSVVAQPIHYVSPAGANVSPYGSWSNAAATIQAAVDAATVPGALVWVTNGTYATGSRNGYPTNMVLAARVCIDKPVVVRSVNGPAVTAIQGQGPLGDSAVRCVVMSGDARLEGFTLTNGMTRKKSEDPYESTGAGAWCLHNDATISNCVFANNVAHYKAGGAYFGTLVDCAVRSNSATWFGGGAMRADLRGCVVEDNQALYGGGQYGGSADRCRFFHNNASRGGGTYLAAVRNSLLYGNEAYQGGGAHSGELINCTVVGNVGTNGPGILSVTARNSIIHGNRLTGGGTNNWGSGCVLAYCCTTPDPGGEGNRTDDPGFLDPGTGQGDSYVLGDLHLRPESPCLNAGTNEPWMAGAMDFDGGARMANGIVDMGAYELEGPVLAVSPLSRAVDAPAGTTPFAVTNAGTGTFTYQAETLAGWLTIIAGAAGTNGGTILVAYDANVASSARTGTVTVTAPGAAGSPATLAVIQAKTPAVPLTDLAVGASNLAFRVATNGFSGYAVEGADCALLPNYAWDWRILSNAMVQPDGIISIPLDGAKRMVIRLRMDLD